MSLKRLFGPAVLLFAATLAAVVSHVLIDFAGDFVLSNDTYDHVAHDSRVLGLGIIVVFGLAVFLRLVFVAVREASGEQTALRDLVSGVAEIPAWRFAAYVVVVALGTLLAMEAFDTILAGARIDDFRDALGGSIALGLGILVPIAALFGIATHAVLRLIARAHRVIVGAICALFLLVDRLCAPLEARAAFVTVSPLCGSGSILARRAGKRAPPICK